MTTIIMDEIDGAFYLAYGRAMAGWSSVERSLGGVFARITHLSDPVATAVYYSAKSLQGRVEMVRAVIPFARTVPPGREFLTRSCSLISSWSATRNRLAHDPHVLHVDQTDDIARPKVTRKISSMKAAEPVELEHLERAQLNFNFLAMVIAISLAQRRLLRDPELSLALLDLLPADPARTGIDLEAANSLSMRIGQIPV
jgi:hypothetical protein